MEYSSLDFLGANPETPLLDLKSIGMNAEELLKRIEVLEAKIKSLEPLDNTQAENEAKEKAIQVELLKLKLD